MMSLQSLPVVLLLLGAALAAPPTRASSDAVAQRVGKEINAFQAIMKTGSADLDIPVLEPLVVEDTPIVADSDILKATGSLKNLRVDGMSTFTVTTLTQVDGDSRKGRVSLDIYVPTATATCEYDLHGKLILGFIKVNLSGKSPVQATVTGIKAGADIDITINADGSVTIDNISNVHYKYDSAKVHVDSMNGLVNGLLNKIIPGVLKANEKTIKQLIAQEGKTNINIYLDKRAGKTTVTRKVPLEQVLSLAAQRFVVPEEVQRLFMQMLLAA